MASNVEFMEQNSLKIDHENQISNIENSKFLFKFKDFTLDLSQKTHLMGILNITPDSFSDGDLYKTTDEYLFRIEDMLDQGADIIDIGAESTKPGAVPVSSEEELGRLMPVLEKAVSRFETIFSVDTTKSIVAKEALEQGVSIINDISGLTFDPEIAGLVARNNAGIVLMHTPGRPKDMQGLTNYDSLVPEIISFLKSSITSAMSFGINFESIAVDPGIGFGKTVKQNLEIIRNLSDLLELGRPVLIGTSRKSFIGKLLNEQSVNNRLEGSIASVTASIMNGASIVRAHDIKETKKIIKVTDAILGKN